MRRVSSTAGLMVLAPPLVTLAAAPLFTDPSFTPAESKAGWRLLFDGKDHQRLGRLQKTDFPSDRWIVKIAPSRTSPPERATRTEAATSAPVDKFSDFDLVSNGGSRPAATAA